jgi:iron complex transport system substrate-binding protein
LIGWWVEEASRDRTDMRVVSLLPSATEILYALGVEPVGVSHECDHPPAARELPAVNRSRIDADASSAEIDAQVQAAADEGGVYEVDRERLAALDPDLVVSQGICDVCAVDEVLVREAVAALGLGADVLTTDPHRMEDVLDDVTQLGAALDREGAATALRTDLESRIDTVADRTTGGPRVAVLDWLEPPMVAGHWIPELVDLAGGSYGLAEPGARSRPREWREIAAYDPEFLVAAPCGFGLEQTLDDRELLTDRPGWDDLAAVRRGDVYVMDGHHYVNRPGPRLVDTLEALAAVLDGRADAVADDICRRLDRVPA